MSEAHRFSLFDFLYFLILFQDNRCPSVGGNLVRLMGPGRCSAACAVNIVLANVLCGSLLNKMSLRLLGFVKNQLGLTPQFVN